MIQGLTKKGIAIRCLGRPPIGVTYFRFYAVWSIDDCTDYAGVHASVGRRAYDAITQLASNFDRIAWRSADTLLVATQRYHDEAQNHHSHPWE